jgi:hypothetical protein
MKLMNATGKLWHVCAALVLGVLVCSMVVRAQEQQQQPAPQTPPSKKDQVPKDQPPSPLNRLTIEVTGGDENKPVENASVYLKTVEQRLIKDKKTEVQVKTDRRGIAHIPDAPAGRVLIQIVAEGWKTYGQWHDVNDAKQVIKIHLERPPKWY